MSPWFILLLLCASITVATSSTGFRVQLTHVRIPRRFEPLMSGVTAPVISLDSGIYVAAISVGNPPQPVGAIVSTADDLVSTQCSNAFYDYKRSSTGQVVPCGDAKCPQPCVIADADDDDSACRVQVDGVPAVLVTDEFDFGTAKVNVTFACTTGDIYGGASGYLGLGRGASSLVSQLGSRRFAYCLSRYSERLESSHLFVGSSAGLRGNAPVTSTRFARRSPHGDASGYCISMSGMSVGDASLDIPRDAFHGGVSINSAYPFMSLVDVAYKALKEEMTRQLGSSLVPPPDGMYPELCMAQRDVSLLIQPLVLHLGGGGELAVPMDKLWMPMDDDTACMVVMRANDDNTILGSLMQQDLHVLFDLDAETVSFQPAHCGTM